MVTSTERRSQRYGFQDLDTMRHFFSRWIPDEEIRLVVRESEEGFRPRQGCTDRETFLQKIQKAEFAIVRRLVDRSPLLP